jgi:hypothetical protein
MNFDPPAVVLNTPVVGKLRASFDGVIALPVMLPNENAMGD